MRVPLVVEVSQVQQGGATTGGQLGEATIECRPEPIGVQPLDRADSRIRVGQFPLAHRASRDSEREQQQLEPLVGLVLRDVAQPALGLRAAPADEGVERVLETRALIGHPIDQIALAVGVQRTVEHHRPHVARKLLGVRGPYPGAVGVPQVGELAVAQR